MAPVKLLSLTERISNKGDVVNAVELGLGDTGVKALVAQRHPSKAFSVSATGPGWTASHDTESKDWLFSMSRSLAGGTLDIFQAVPGARFFLVPTPLLRFTRRFDRGDGGGADTVSAEFDNLTRRSAVSQTFTTADGLKAGITLDSVAGLTLGADAKVEGRGAVRAVGGQYNSQAGPLLRVRARPAPWAEAVASLHPRTRTAGVTAMLAPAWLATGPGKTATMTVDVSAPYGDPRAAAGGKRGALKGAVGMKWGF